jgi:hypothetical protein
VYCEGPDSNEKAHLMADRFNSNTNRFLSSFIRNSQFFCSSQIASILSKKAGSSASALRIGRDSWNECFVRSRPRLG